MLIHQQFSDSHRRNQSVGVGVGVFGYPFLAHHWCAASGMLPMRESVHELKQFFLMEIKLKPLIALFFLTKKKGRKRSLECRKRFVL